MSKSKLGETRFYSAVVADSKELGPWAKALFRQDMNALYTAGKINDFAEYEIARVVVLEKINQAISEHEGGT